MNSRFLALGILGILLILFGSVFALQGDGMIGGSPMSGNSFWLYVGSGLVVVGVIVAVLGFLMGFRSRTSNKITKKENVESGAETASTESHSSTGAKKVERN